MADGCFLVLCGIPASGKSTVVKSLSKKERNIAGKSVHFLHINYDDFIPENLPVADFSQNATWKERRRNILDSLEQFLIPNERISLERHIQPSNKPIFVTNWCPCGFDSRIMRCNDILHVIVIDDNMFYRSMRYEYYQLARKVLFGFAQVYVYCSLDVALMRDAERTSPVGDETIVKMSSRIEEPDPGKFSWEKFSATIDTSQRLDIWNVIFTLLENATLSPPPPLEMSDHALKAKDVDRDITMKSIVHQADQVIRKFISIKLTKMKANDSPCGLLKQEASFLNRRRKMVLEQIKNNPCRLMQHTSKDRDVHIARQSTQLKDFFIAPVPDNVGKSDKTLSEEAKKVTANVDIGPSADEHLLEVFWERLSPDEFADAVKMVFDQI